MRHAGTRWKRSGRITGIGVGAAMALALGACAPGGQPDSSGTGSPETSAPTDGPVRQGNYIESDDAIENEYIVALNPQEMRIRSVDRAAQNLLSNFGPDATMVRSYEHAMSGFMAEMPPEAAKVLADQPGVRFVEQNKRITLDATQQDATWGLDRIDQLDLPLDDVYNFETDGSGVNVYVIDTGIRTSHEEFEGRAQHGFSSIDDNNGSDDCNGHGTHVAGTVGSAEYGVAKNVTLHAVRVLDCQGSGTLDGVIAGIDWVTQNAQGPAVANMSLGGGSSAALDEAVQNSIEAGITYAVAAGNESTDACTKSPAAVDAALTVGSTTDSDSRSYFSNTGECVDIFAPGSGITSTWNGSDTDTNTISGTSMASPHVAGVAALYVGENPGAAPSEVFSALTGNAAEGKVSNPGSGSPNLLLYSGFIGGGGGGGGNDAPTATVTAPADGATVSGSVEVSATASDSDGSVARVEFQLPDGSTVDDSSSPYGTTWDSTTVADGGHDISAVAFDDEGAASTAATVTVEVANGGGGGGGDGWGASDTPNLATEDNGVVCTSVDVAADGDAADAHVDLAGQHDWRSSLRATLEHGGTTVEVFSTGTFDRGAGSFSLSSEAVAGFSGSSAGTWTLCIEDTDGYGDTGVLDSWGVHDGGGGGGGTGDWGASDEPGLATEDDGVVCTSVDVAADGDAADAHVDLAGQHDWRSSLRATLEHGGTTQEVFSTGTFDRGAGSFSLSSEAVAGFSGSATGTWTLCIEDTDGYGDTGVLESWGVHN